VRAQMPKTAAIVLSIFQIIAAVVSFICQVNKTKQNITKQNKTKFNLI